jgi:hypothetical protein
MVEICKCCGARIKEFIVPLSKNNIQVLLTIWRTKSDKAYITTKEIYGKVKSSSPTAELTRLKYLGAIEPYFDSEDLKKESHRSGKWIITKNGSDFIKKKGTLPKHVIVRNGQVIRHEEGVFIDDPCLKWDTESDIWKELKEYYGKL